MRKFRDINAAINILKEGLKNINRPEQSITPAERTKKKRTNNKRLSSLKETGSPSAKD